ncbi:ABC transporter ATP-binding protein [Paenibacillus allorhizosphaerae]|uniref:Multidrug export ATP-binding/permease protein n=1 Tax=Paenibacillus allorhizosphaerae TaxID=2849866 RepID=A0ABM8VV57_9BACL|nr:ABC transporter ATP-binding protein [Paenibacillus allorhizosphaerae]CAG7659158.1 Putative multidrug export ATP-binding/permease protein [Paenibacillus allorhizosphaerae]
MQQVLNVIWLFHNIKFMIWSLLLAGLLSILDMASLLGITGVQKWLIDEVFIESRYDMLPRLLLIFAALIIGYNAIHLISFMLNRFNAYRLQEKFTLDMMQYLYKMPVKKYHNQRVADLAVRFSDDIGAASNIASQLIPNGITDLMKAVVLAVIVGLSSPVILGIILILSVAYIAMGRYFGPKNREIGKQVQKARSEVLVNIEEGISSTREVLAYHRTDWEIDKYNKNFSRFFDIIMKEGRIGNKQLIWSDFFRWGINLTVLACGGYLAFNGQITIGTFIVVYQFATQLMDTMKSVFDFAMGFAARMASVERIREFITETEPQKRELVFLDGTIRSIRFEQVSFKYNDETDYILNTLKLDIPVGKKVALVGSSGGGKSTIAQLLIRFFDPAQGKILVNGIPLNQISLSNWREKVNIVFQEPYLFPDTIRNNLLMGRTISETEMRAACLASEIHEFIESLPDRYDTILGERGVTLSGGQRQRLALARSLLSDPEVLILDESTSALDMETERRVQRNLDALREGKTTIIIAHRLSTIRDADKIYVMDQGVVVEDGTHEELMREDTHYRKLIQAKVEAN